MEHLREELVVLGTGNATVSHCYNTCFALRSDTGVLLVDAGGGNGILTQLDRAGIALGEIHDVFLTHQHCDHLLGAVWLIRMAAQGLDSGRYHGEMRIYCHADLARRVEALVALTLQPSQLDKLGHEICLIPVTDGEKRVIAGWPVCFFDIHSTKVQQFGCSVTLQNGEKLTFLGDEPYNEANCDAVAGSSWLLSEAFCLSGEAEKFHPYEKHHSTVREACRLAQRFAIPHLVLWHTEETHLPQRRALYTREGAEFYSGALFVPDDLDVIPLSEG